MTQFPISIFDFLLYLVSKIIAGLKAILLTIIFFLTLISGKIGIFDHEFVRLWVLYVGVLLGGWDWFWSDF